jgi:hypothetical protein
MGGEPLVLVHVIAPITNVGDVMGRLSSLGGWLDGYTDSDPTRVTARLPQSSIPKFQKWLAAWLPDVAECIVISEDGRGNV